MPLRLTCEKKHGVLSERPVASAQIKIAVQPKTPRQRIMEKDPISGEAILTLAAITAKRKDAMSIHTDDIKLLQTGC